MYSHYGITRSSHISLSNATHLLIKAIERKKEQEKFSMWIAMLPHLESELGGSFELFKKNMLTTPIRGTDISPEAIEDEMLSVMGQYEKQKDEG